MRTTHTSHKGIYVRSAQLGTCTGQSGTPAPNKGPYTEEERELLSAAHRGVARRYQAATRGGAYIQVIKGSSGVRPRGD